MSQPSPPTPKSHPMKKRQLRQDETARTTNNVTQNKTHCVEHITHQSSTSRRGCNLMRCQQEEIDPVESRKLRWRFEGILVVFVLLLLAPGTSGGPECAHRPFPSPRTRRPHIRRPEVPRGATSTERGRVRRRPASSTHVNGYNLDVP